MIPATRPCRRVRELLARDAATRLRVKETEDIIRLRNKELNLLPEPRPGIECQTGH